MLRILALFKVSKIVATSMGSSSDFQTTHHPPIFPYSPINLLYLPKRFPTNFSYVKVENEGTKYLFNIVTWSMLFFWNHWVNRAMYLKRNFLSDRRDIDFLIIHWRWSDLSCSERNSAWYKLNIFIIIINVIHWYRWRWCIFILIINPW